MNPKNEVVIYQSIDGLSSENGFCDETDIRYEIIHWINRHLCRVYSI